MMMDQDDLLRLTGQVDDKYLDEAAGYQPKRSFWKTVLGIVVRKLIELLIIIFMIFALLTVAENSYEDCNGRLIDEAGYTQSALEAP